MHFLRRTRARLTSTPQSNATPGQLPSKATIGGLDDKVLLKIFGYFLDVSPRHWPRLVHICRRWRLIVFASQRTLHLRLYCTHGTPVRKSLGCWPASLPIVVEYGGSPGLDPPAPKDEDNIIAALKRSKRVISISLTFTNSLQRRLSLFRFKGRFSKLEDLFLLSPEYLPHTLVEAFWLSPRLRRLHLTRIAVPRLFQPLYCSRNLVDLRLHDLYYPEYFSPEALTEVLSGMGQLLSLSISLRFYSTALREVPPPSSEQRVVLPVLSRLDFRGIPDYLEDLMARIHAPCLDDIEITSVDDSFLGLSKLTEFLDRHKSRRRVYISSSDNAISISFIQLGSPTCIKLQVLSEQFGEQLSFMSRICNHFSLLLFDVEDLRISATRQWEDNFSVGHWLKPITSFTGVKWFHLDGCSAINIVRALQHRNRERIIVQLPALLKIYVSQPWARHAPLKEAVASLMSSRRLSGRPIAAEYEQLCDITEPHGAGRFSQQITTEILCDDLVLNIFRHILNDTPRFWPTLASVCKRWRRIVLTSPLGLNLRLHCTHGTPVLKALYCWPALPIVILYGGIPNLDPPALEDDDNIIAALKESDRVSSISLTVTRSLVEKLSTISEPLSELEDLTLLSRDDMQRPVALPSTFRWGPRLRTLLSTRIAFPSFPQLLLPSQGLIDLQLHEIPVVGYVSPEALANALSGMTQLRLLSLHFLSLPPRRKFLSLPPQPEERAVLPALSRLKYRGTSKYLDSLVARIDAPLLGDIDITFFSQPTMDASQLGKFIERIEMSRPSRAEVETSSHAISISLTNSSTSTPFRLQISCKLLDWQLSCMAQVCHQFSPVLFRVEELSINTTQSSSGQDDGAGEQWLELVRSFGGARDIRITEELLTDVLRALGRADPSALPTLRHLRLDNPNEITNEASWDALLSFINSRLHSGHPVQVNVPLSQCHICHASFRQQKGLGLHLVHEHSYRLMCSYCGDFELKPGHDHLFRDHLESRHPEVVRNDELFSNPLSTLDVVVNKHSSVHAPYIVVPSTTATLPHSQ